MLIIITQLKTMKNNYPDFRYNLKYYLPVYLWANDCTRRKVNPFWELMEIIGSCEDGALFGLQTELMTPDVISL